MFTDDHMNKYIAALLTIMFFIIDSSYAYTTNFNKPSANYYLVCPYCATKTNAESEDGINKQCSNEKCKEQLSSQPIVPAGKEAFKLASQIKEDRIRKANSLNIKSSNGIKCPYCLRNSELDRYELLAIVEGRKSRTIICDGKNCGRTYDLTDGLNFYEIQRQKEVNAIMTGVVIMGCAVAGAAIAANSRRRGYVPTYTALPTIPSYTTATRAIMPISQGGSYNVQRIGNFDYVHGLGGYSGSGQRIGNFYYYNDNQGGEYSSQAIGSFDYMSGSGGYSGSGQKIGNFYYYNDNKGGNYNMQRIGKFDYVSGSDGYSGSGQQIGDFYYYNDNK